MDRALKLLNQKEFAYDFEKNTEVKIYKAASEIILAKGDFEEAKDLAYRYLRKTWHYNKK